MKAELDCQWHFANVANNDGEEGPNSAMSQTFAQFPCASLVRESIQNSLDAAISDNETVVVCFEHRSFDTDNYRNFFKLSEHIKACKEYYHSNNVAQAIYPEMLDILNKSNELGYIKVSDFHTKGMSYDENSTNSTFYAFVRAAGVSVKAQAGSGGSFGFGKGAFFVMSPINTIIVSSRDTNNNCYFEGVTRLCSHKINGVKYSHMGFYDNNQGTPANNEERIPLPFRRDTSGTTIGIMGIDWASWKSSIDELAKEVLSNFFVAILRKKLIVYINGNEKNNRDAIILNDETLKDVIFQYFPSIKEVRSRGSFNPRPYYEAMTNSEIEPITAELPTLGQVSLYIKEFENNVTQIIFLRKLLMKVYRDSRSLGCFNCVFICENTKGNNILSDMEDQEHKMWTAERCKSPDKKTDYETARLALSELDEFINSSLDKVLGINSSDSDSVKGLEKYLPTDDMYGKGEKNNPFSGHRTGNYVSEGSSLTTEGVIKPEEKKKPIRGVKGSVIEIQSGNVVQQEDSDEIIGIGGKKHGGGGDAVVPGDHFIRGVIEQGNGSFKRLIKVDWRPIQSVKKGFTDIVIYPPKSIPSAELQFQIGRESGSKKSEDEDVSIVFTNKGEAQGLKILHVPLMADSKNIIQVAFSDNLSHSLILDVYEID